MPRPPSPAGPTRGCVIRADRERDVTGRQWVTLLVGDSARAALTLESIEARESGRGLAIVRDLVRAWRGHLRRAPRVGAAARSWWGRRFRCELRRSTPGSASSSARTAHEYLERFRRFLGDAFDFCPAHDFSEAHAAAAGADGLLLDLDFRRTPPERLVDERGPAPAPLDAGTRARLAETQGILILRRLRAAGVALPAILFADLDDADSATSWCGRWPRSPSLTAAWASPRSRPSSARSIRAGAFLIVAVPGLVLGAPPPQRDRAADRQRHLGDQRGRRRRRARRSAEPAAGWR